MATLIKEQMRNPINNDWIPLREIEGDVNGVTAIKQLGVDGNPLNINGPLRVENGQLVTVDKLKGLLDLGIEGIHYADGVCTVEINSGGTGARTAEDALTNLGAVAKAGDTMTGDLHIEKSYPTLRLFDSDGNKLGAFQGIDSNHRISVVSYPTDSNDCFEGYYFPIPSTGLTASESYQVLTSKSPVTVSQGGTGADNAVEALHNLGITWGEEVAPETGPANTIYIQLLPAEEE